jgi:SNF2 family DNA or RNA helicase
MSEEYEGSPVEMTPELREQIRLLNEIKILPPPEGLQAQLRPYQQRGFSWLYKNLQLGFGSILADDMGLGKTLQVITLLQQLKNEGDLSPQNRVLIVAPTTLLSNWERELAKFAPQLRRGIFHGAKRELKELAETEIIITTYGTTRTDKATLSKEKWLCLVIDEAQNIKNASAEQSKSVKSIPARSYLALSGTPVENRLSEYWSIFDFSNKGYLGSGKQFKNDYAIPIEADRDQKVLQRFHKVTAPFVMRRLKTDKSIISDLPDKLEINQYCQLTPQQAALYESMVEKSMRDIEANEGKARNALVLTLILALKQICNHPTQYLKKGKADAELSGKCPLLLDLVSQAFDNDEKVLIFTQFREMGDLLVKILEAAFDMTVPYLHGGTTRPNRDKMVEDFQQKRSSRLMILSLKAAGTGLNLTAASQVIHFDLWWNPAVEAQATDRAFRIGQTKNVVAHRFITTATFEERIDAMIQEKKALANLTVANGEQWIGDLSNQELRTLFALGK